MSTEREFLTQRRIEQLATTPRLAELEQWQQYSYIPLDIPRFENPQLVDWFFNKACPVIKQAPDASTKGVGLSLYDSVDVFPNGYTDSMISNAIWTLNIQQEFMELFSNVYKQILEGFPFKSVNKITMWNSQRAIGWHRDDARFTDCPNEFRVLIYDSNPQSTLQLVPAMPDTDIESLQTFTAPRIAETNSFAWNNLRTKHSTSYDPEHRKIIMVFSRLEIDIDRYHDLMKRSVAKYQDKTMIMSNPTSDWVDIT